MSNLKTVFADHKAFISFVVAGDPDFDETVKQVVALAKAGCDLIELGIPFSDPVADGPEIQAADLRAFAAGTTTDQVFKMVAKIREETNVPLAFLTYTNIVFKYGYERFTSRCDELDVRGLIIPDLPLEEQGELRPFTEKHHLSIIQLIAPSSPLDRIAKISKQASGFIYVVSSMGVTGMRNQINTDLQKLTSEIRKYTDVPTAIGFGVHEPAQAKSMSQVADGVIVGSAIVHQIASQTDVSEKLTKYVQSMRAAMVD